MLSTMTTTHMKMTLNGGRCVDGDPACVGPRHPAPFRSYRCPECNTALEDAADERATERSL